MPSPPKIIQRIAFTAIESGFPPLLLLHDLDRGMPAGHEFLKCLSSKPPAWIGDPYFDNKVRHRCVLSLQPLLVMLQLS